jgi:CRP-like cAMP-binding protein
MKSVGAKSNILKVSDKLKAALESAGRKRGLPPARILFREDGKSAGVFLVCKGKVLMGIRIMPKLDRVFSAGSLLGLPATFTRHPYSLTAVTVVPSDVVHVPREEFLQLMRARPDLCREATDILGREVTFIQSALAERRARTRTIPKRIRVAAADGRGGTLPGPLSSWLGTFHLPLTAV